MPALKHTQLFDFPGYEQGIKDAKAATVDFAKSVEGVLQRLNVQQKDLVAGLGEYAQFMKVFNVSQAGATDNLKKYNQEIDDQIAGLNRLKETEQGWTKILDINKASVAELKAEYSGLKKQYENLSPVSKDYAQTVEQIKNRIQQVVPGIQQFTAATRVNQTVVAATEGSYARMQQELTALRAQLRNMPGAFDEMTGKLNKNNVEAVNLAQRIGQLDQTLKQADATMGMYVRNVGNYKSGFNGLGVSIAQITRELPNFAMNLQTGFMAISNNIPMIKDEIDRLKNANRELISQGEKPISIWKQLSSAIFSWNSLLSIGIVALTVYGKQFVQWIGSLFKGKQAVDQQVESIKLLNKALSSSEFTSAVKNIDELRINIDLAKQGFLSKKDVVEQYNKTIGQTTGQVNDLKEAEIGLQKNADNYIKMTLYKAAAQLALNEAAKKAVEAEEARLKKETEFSKLSDKFVSASDERFMTADDMRRRTEFIKQEQEKRKANAIKIATDAEQAQVEIAKNFQAKAADIAAKNKFNFFGDISKDATKATKDAEEALKKLEEKIKKQIELLKSGAELSIKADELRLSKEEINEDEFQKNKLEIIRKYIEQAIDLEQSLGKHADKARIDDLKKTLIEAEIEFNKFEEVRMKRVHFVQPTRAGLPVSDVQTTDEMLKMFENTAKAKIDAENKAFDIIRAGRDTSFREELDHLERLKATRLKYAQSTAEEEYAIKRLNAERERQLEVETRAFAIEAISTGIQVLQEINQGKSQARIASLEQERQDELKLAGNNAAAREKIEKDFQDRIKKEKRKAAQTDKAFALFNVALNTAQAVTKTIAEWGMPFAIPFIFLAIGQGLLQAALIAAKPLPQFRFGTKSAPAGPVITGEAGFEIVNDKKTGQLRITGGRGAGVDWMTGGEEIFTHTQSRRMIERGIQLQELENQRQSEALASQLRKGRSQEVLVMQGQSETRADHRTSKLIDGFNNALKNQPREGNIYDERGWRFYREEQNNRTEYLNKNHAF